MTTFPKGKLIDFFLYFDPSNQFHLAAVNRFQDDIEMSDPSLLTDEANWVHLFRTELQQDIQPDQVDNTWSGITLAARKAGAKFPELLAAQWALESGFGKHPSGKNNYWGIKGHGGRNPSETQTLKSTSEYIDGEWVSSNYWFQNFASIEAGADYVVDRWYKDFKNHLGVNRANSRDEAAYLLVKEGYATDPEYADKLINLMDQYCQSPSSDDGCSVELKVPYLSQIDSQTDQGFRMCFSSACAMAVDYLCPNILKDHKDDFYLQKVNEYGATTDPYAQLYALQSFGLDADFRQDLSLSDIKDQINKGIPVPMGILHNGSTSSPSGGHWITAIGYNEEGLVVHDPRGELDLVSGVYLPHASGERLQYSYQNLLPRWNVEGDKTGWGIVIN